MIVIGGILATASHGVTIDGMFWMMTVARGVVGFGMIISQPLERTLPILTYLRYWRRVPCIVNISIGVCQ